MARYLARPPIATDRLTEREDGRLELRLKRPWRDGTTAFLFTPHELIERLVAQIPRPRAHLTRYHGVLAPAFAARSQIVPRAEEAKRKDRPATKSGDSDGKKKPRPPSRIPWASLIWRVFLKDVLECARCSGRMEVVAAVTSREAVVRIIGYMGLPTGPPPLHPPRPPPQATLPFDISGFEPDPPAPDDFDP